MWTVRPMLSQNYRVVRKSMRSCVLRLQKSEDSEKGKRLLLICVSTLAGVRMNLDNTSSALREAQHLVLPNFGQGLHSART